MKPNSAPDKLRDVEAAPERGYAEWKRAKIERALDQAKDRASMISVEQIVRDLGL